MTIPLSSTQEAILNDDGTLTRFDPSAPLASSVVVAPIAGLAATNGQAAFAELVADIANVPSLLVGTADPSAGGGVAHPQPALYLRNNAGATELWVTTGAGATAWAKVTVP